MRGLGIFTLSKARAPPVRLSAFYRTPIADNRCHDIPFISREPPRRCDGPNPVRGGHRRDRVLRLEPPQACACFVHSRLGRLTMRFAIVIAWTALMMVLCAIPGHADKRVALVVGNSTYHRGLRCRDGGRTRTRLASRFAALAAAPDHCHRDRSVHDPGRNLARPSQAATDFAGRDLPTG